MSQMYRTNSHQSHVDLAYQNNHNQLDQLNKLYLILQGQKYFFSSGHCKRRLTSTILSEDIVFKSRKIVRKSNQFFNASKIAKLNINYRMIQ